MIAEAAVSTRYPELNKVTPEYVKNVEDDLVIVYNRVPKTASTSFVGVAYDLCKKNQFHVLHVNVTANNHIFSLNNQYKLVNNMTSWDAVKPALYHGHFAFIDFSKWVVSYSTIKCIYLLLFFRFGVPKPLFINIIRKPLERFVSYYYFIRYGDNYRPYLVRRKHGNTMVRIFYETANEIIKWYCFKDVWWVCIKRPFRLWSQQHVVTNSIFLWTCYKLLVRLFYYYYYYMKLSLSLSFYSTWNWSTFLIVYFFISLIF